MTRPDNRFPALPPAYAPLLEGLKEWLDRHDYTGRSRTTYLSLLHRFLIHLASWDIPFQVIKAWCGHADLGVTLKVYEGVANAPEGVVPV